MYVGFFLNPLLTISMYQTEYYCRKYKMSDFALFCRTFPADEDNAWVITISLKNDRCGDSWGGAAPLPPCQLVRYLGQTPWHVIQGSAERAGRK